MPVSKHRFNRISTRISAARALAVSLLGAGAVLAAPAQAAPLVVFGDSLSDGGNIAALGFYDPNQVVSGNSYVPSATYAPSGTFTNGSVWVDGFAAAMGWTIEAALRDPAGSNFAFGGARVSGSGAVPSLVAQTDMYLDRVGGVADPNALYVVAGGGNDARDALSAYGAAYVAAFVAGSADPHGEALAASLPAAIQSYVLGMNIVLQSLQQAGATQLIVWNLPYLGGTPALESGGVEVAMLGDAIARAFNEALSSQVLIHAPGARLFDFYELGHAYVDGSAAFNFGNVDDACGAVAGADCSTYLWWDGIHPTTAAHKLIAAAMFEVASEMNEVPEPSMGSLLLAAAVFGGLSMRRRKAEPRRR